MPIAHTAPADRAPKRLEELAQAWRQRATELHAFAAEGAANAFDTAASELEQALAGDGSALVGLTVAARKCGYDADSLGRMLRKGKLRNYGTKYRPRVRIGDLPRKPALPRLLP